LPSIPQKDFLADIARAYNLVFVPDKFDDKLIEVEPWNDWMSSGGTFNITPYVDQSVKVSVKPTTELQSRSLQFLMAEGESLQEEQFVKRFNTPEGSVNLKDTGNEFAQGETKIQTDFVGTLMQRDQSSLVQWPQLTDSGFEAVGFGQRLGYWSGVDRIFTAL